jgi:hypothetical protein
MLNHVKKGLERTYDLYEMEEEKRAWFLKWEQEIAAIAERAGVADALGYPRPHRADSTGPGYSVTINLPQRARVQPAVHFGSLEARTSPMLAQPAAKLVLAGETGRPAFAQAVDLAPGKPG